ncbi:unnamed protein product [Polarella glacialis]|uniref:EGF-like domain-containing protein n=1 Tax=Polarella glacialis TaxID=89957 RepID=A0A813EB97_POLGL|nr:unnamed protein product [Polarella glacialis]
MLRSGTNCTPRCKPGFRPRTATSRGRILEPAAVESATLHCEDGLLQPTSSFDCQHVFVPMLDFQVTRSRRWTAFQLPRRLAGIAPNDTESSEEVTVTFLIAAAASLELAVSRSEGFGGSNDESAVSRIVRGQKAVLLRGAPGPQLSLRPVLSLGFEALDVLPLWAGSSLLLVAVASRTSASGGTFEGCSPVLRWEVSADGSSVRTVKLQQLPLVGLPSRLKAVVPPGSPAGQVLLLAPGMQNQGAAGNGPCDSNNNSNNNNGNVQPAAAELPAIFSWNGSNFGELQRLPHGAVALEPFVLAGALFVFGAAGHNGGAQLYRWDSAAGSFVGAPLPGVPLLGAFASVWLGCRDEVAFVSASSGEPCWSLTATDCSQGDVSSACGVLCGCGHAEPLLVVTLTQPVSRVAVFRVSMGESSASASLIEISAAPAAGPIFDFCPIFVPDLKELLIATAAGPSAASPVYMYRPSVFDRGAGVEGELSVVQELDLPGAASCAALALAGGGGSWLVLGGFTAGSSGSGSSRLFLAEGSFEWEPTPWSACSLVCRRSSVSSGLRLRNVTCRGVPSGLEHPSSMCPGPQPPEQETCRNLPLCPKEYYAWQEGSWSNCTGFCGTGELRRNVTCNLAFRLRNRIAVTSGWQVVELAFFLAAAPAARAETPPEAMGSVDLRWPSTGSSTGGGTNWISQCSRSASSVYSPDFVACAPNEAWLGLQVKEAVSVRCVQLLQSGDAAYSAGEVALESWSSTVGAWVAVAEWADLQNALRSVGTAVGVGASASLVNSWDVLVVPRLCSIGLDCSDRGQPQGLPGSCSCVCDAGFAGDRCEKCAVGFLDWPNCWEAATSSMAWRLVAAAPAPSGTWHVEHISLHEDLDCSEASQVPQEYYYEYLASNWPASSSKASPPTAS